MELKPFGLIRMLQEIVMVRTRLLGGRASPLLNRLRINFLRKIKPTRRRKTPLVWQWGWIPDAY